MIPMDSEMAGPSRLKLGVLVEGMWENVLAKEFFDLSMYTRVRLVDHRCLF